MTANLHVIGTNINHSYAMGPHYLKDPEGWAFSDIMSAYSPFAQLRTMTTLFRSGWGVRGYMGAGQAYSLDHILARAYELSGFNVRLSQQLYGGGKGYDLASMVLSTAGEAVERNLGSLAFIAELPNIRKKVASANDLAAEGLNFVDPADYSVFSDEQYNEPGFLFDKWLNSSHCEWVEGIELVSGRPWWVPSQLMYLFNVRVRGEARIGTSSSGGLATHVDKTQVRLHAVLELVERDAINLRWYCGIPPEQIIVDRPFRNKRITSWLESVKRAGMDIRMYYHSLDIPAIAVVTIIAFDRDLEELRYFAGGGVGLDIEDAIVSAMGEFIQSERMNRIPLSAPNWGLAGGIKRGFGANRDEPPERLDNFIQIVAYYGYVEHADKLTWYFDPHPPRTVELSTLPTLKASVEESWAKLLDIMSDNGIRLIELDFTPSMFKSIKLIKVFTPDLVPAFPPNMKMLGHARYLEVPRTLGLRGDDENELTADPVPYP